MRKVIIALIIGIMLAGQASSAGAAAIVADYKAAPAKEADKRQKSPTAGKPGIWPQAARPHAAAAS